MIEDSGNRAGKAAGELKDLVVRLSCTSAQYFAYHI